MVPTAADFQARGRGHLPGLLGMEVLETVPGRCRIRLEAEQRLRAPNGYLHAGTVVALADTACGYGCASSLPAGATGFTTLELKCNLVGTVRAGSVVAEARMVHGGRSTQVWDATVSDESTGRPVALFHCTQFLLRP